MNRRLSVVIPIFNVEAFLPACLDSIRAQTHDDLEVVMVDDGSSDGSVAIAEDYARLDRRFRLLRQDNLGPGPARNLGVANATGGFLAFADGDDVVARTGYERLIGSLEESGSDLACGGVRRINMTGVRPSHLHREVFTTDLVGTHISRTPRLLRDRTVWNKVWRRPYFDSLGLDFPAALYEDIPVALKSHVMAASVDVLAAPVYYWRIREKGDGSITQRTGDLGNIRDRLTAEREMRAFLLERSPGLVREFDDIMCELDLATLAAAMDRAPDAGPIMELVQAFACELDPDAGSALPAIARLRNHFIRRGMLPEMLQILSFAQNGAQEARIRRSGLRDPRWFADYPFRGDAAIAVPDDLYDVTGELGLRTRVTDVRWEGDRLKVGGYAYVPRVGTTAQDRLSAWAVEAGTGKRVPLKIRREPSPELMAEAGHANARYDRAGFALEVAVDQLRGDGKLGRGDWEIRVELRTRGLRRSGPLANPVPGRASWPPHYETRRGMRVQPIVQDGGLTLKVRRVRARIGGIAIEGGDAVITGTFTEPGPAQLVARLAGESVRVAAERVEDERVEDDGFRAVLPLRELLSPHAGGTDMHIGGGLQWIFRLEAGGREYPPVGRPDVPERRWSEGDGELVITWSRSGNLTAIARPVHLTVREAAWEGGRLVLAGDCAAPEIRPAEIRLSLLRGHDTHRFPIRWDGDRFEVRLDLAALPGPAGDLPVQAGSWDFLVRTGEEDQALAVERGLLSALPLAGSVAGRPVSLGYYRSEALRLTVGRPLAQDERGAYFQERLQQREYPRARRRRTSDTIVFQSFGGTQYSCSPRAVFEELRRRDRGPEPVWLTVDERFPAPEGARTVITGSREHHRLMGQAGHLVVNGILPKWFSRRTGQTVLQTWHGTPLKRLGPDRRTPRAERGWIDHQLADRANWSVLLSAGPEVTPLLRRELSFEGEVAEVGTPRTDLLVSPDRDAVSAAVRRRLRIPEDKRVVLYAPTWREDAMLNGRAWFDLRLEVETLRKRLGPDHVLLVRAHHRIGGTNLADDEFVRDVTGHPDVIDLCLAADVLVTDYSSVMFDFAVTGKPMVFFAYDLERYRDEVRGFAFDFEAVAPGPVVRDTEAVAEAVLAGERDAGRHEAFVHRFCPLDDGKAAGRVLDLLGL